MADQRANFESEKHRVEEDIQEIKEEIASLIHFQQVKDQIEAEEVRLKEKVEQQRTDYEVLLSRSQQMINFLRLGETTSFTRARKGGLRTNEKGYDSKLVLFKLATSKDFLQGIIMSWLCFSPASIVLSPCCIFMV